MSIPQINLAEIDDEEIVLRVLLEHRGFNELYQSMRTNHAREALLRMMMILKENGRWMRRSELLEEMVVSENRYSGLIDPPSKEERKEDREKRAARERKFAYEMQFHRVLAKLEELGLVRKHMERERTKRSKPGKEMKVVNYRLDLSSYYDLESLLDDPGRLGRDVAMLQRKLWRSYEVGMAAFDALGLPGERYVELLDRETEGIKLWGEVVTGPDGLNSLEIHRSFEDPEYHLRLVTEIRRMIAEGRRDTT
jgi:hypothetical protein